MKKSLLKTLIIFTFPLFFSILAYAAPAPLEKLTLPPGFVIENFVDDLPGARTMALGKNGTIFVGTRGQGKVYALIPTPNATQKVQVLTLLSHLNEPHGIAFHQGDLYIAEIHRITKYPNIEENLQHPPKPIVLNDTLPHATWHGYRILGVGPDEQLYLAVGMPCNTCNYRTTVPIYGTISRMALSGGEITPYAIGVRNSVGFTWHPKTKDLWFTDNGQDFMGDEEPPDKINRADKAGLDFGFPFVVGDNQLAPGYLKAMLPNHTLTTPAFKLPAHVAPLGIIFYNGDQFPKQYRQQIFVALHGSWNRSKKIGYEVVQLTLEGNRVINMKPFITGFLQPAEEVLGRPVAMLELADGSMLISDDYNGAIYRVRYP